MTSYEYLLELFSQSGPLAAVFYMLRGSIDRRKGAVIEVAAVTLPILLSAIFLAIQLGDVFSREFGNSLSVVIEVVFLTLPVFVVASLLERLRDGERLQIADIFRITTTCALLFFVNTNLVVELYSPALVLFASTFIAADWARESSKVSFNLAIVFAAAFMLFAALYAIVNVQAINALRSFGSVFPSGAVQTTFEVLTMLLPFIFFSPLFERLVIRQPWFTSLALRIARIQFANGSSSDQIFKSPLFELWSFDRKVTFLNHGSFGAVPNVLRHAQQRLRQRCENEPMNFLTRELEKGWFDARFSLAVWLGTTPENIAFCENATAGMNEIAHWFPLTKDDEVVMNDHEYGAVRRIWQRRCDEVGAKLVEVKLPMPLSVPQAITDSILAACNERTRIVIVSHITSPTAIVLPVAKICAALRERGIASCVDGPHALLQEQFKLYNLNCDFYTASCHKWLCAPLGSGFVYMDPRWHNQFQPARLSWGRLKPAKPKKWSDELLWTGSRDYSAYLTVPNAIKYFAGFDSESLDARNYELACYARRKLSEIPGAEPVTPEGREWFGWMVGVWLPEDYHDYDTLQQRLWQRYRIEVPIVCFGERHLVRASCPLYITTHDIDKLVRCLTKELQAQSR